MCEQSGHGVHSVFATICRIRKGWTQCIREGVCNLYTVYFRKYVQPASSAFFMICTIRLLNTQSMLDGVSNLYTMYTVHLQGCVEPGQGVRSVFTKVCTISILCTKCIPEGMYNPYIF